MSITKEDRKLGVTNIWLQNMGNVICNDMIFGQKLVRNGHAAPPTFLGVFTSDTLNTIPVREKFQNVTFIANMSPSNTTGTHFIACHVQNNVCWYFDPMGMPSSTSPDIDFFLRNRYTYIIELLKEENKIQASSSVFCGFFCLAFLCSRMFTNTLEQYHFLFEFKLGGENAVKENDDTAVDYVKKCIHQIYNYKKE